ncbi:zinc-binding dehydrogenase [Leptospira sp. GIMC2001]|uniref:zinc-binding dehydrogenase n=1 Tax=Leptospira sp. GIMC2001 TaxID=1513297 RepID=UPI00234B3345|nr:zinc-binding dehydrogenase [Leptospira sp. GIMC2001]WCL48586.1 zinc-binding dehydrogenase [Leptospira sp. GIMC2001]
MRAAILENGLRKVEIREKSIAGPTDTQVKIRIKACGVCGSDVHLIAHGTIKCRQYPRVPGHEASGVVEEIGQSVTKFKKGDRVVIAAGTSCGICKHCLAGHENLCKDIGVFGFDCDGSFAEFLIAEERYLYSLPDSIPFDQGAILADAVSTPYHAIRYRGNIQESDTVAIIGCGGLGIHGVAIARALTKSKLVAIDVDDGALENAVHYGADDVINLKNVKNPGKALKEVTKGVDLLVDFSGYMSNVEESLRAMNSNGRIVLVGIGRQPLKFLIPFILIEKMISVGGSYGSDRRAIPELIDLYTQGKINLSRSITSHHGLDEINDCIEALESRKGNPIRYIIDPSLD